VTFLQVKIRTFEAGDLHRVDAFYERHAGSFLPSPSMKEVAAAGEAGLFLVAEDEYGELQAVAGLFPLALCLADDGREVQVYELAGMALNGARVGGLGPHTLQDVLLWIRILTLAASEHTNVCVVTSVVAANSASLQAVRRAGFVESPTPGWMLASRRSWCAPSLGPVVDLVLQPSAVCVHADAFLQRPALTRENRETRETEFVVVESEEGWFRTFLEPIRALSRGAAPQWEAAIPSVELIEAFGTRIEFRGSTTRTGADSGA
jgi:hypothetical protein